MELKDAPTILTCCPLDTWQSTCSSVLDHTMSLVQSTFREQIKVVGGTLVEQNPS